MQANPLTIDQLFGRSIRYSIPIFQRHYVWNLNDQWEPFWYDILSKTNARLDEHPDVFPHYVGAIVLEAQKSRSVRNVAAYNTIDGQQRLATFQIFLAALRDISSLYELKPLNTAINRHLLNPDPELMFDKDIEIFKVWPTKYDRQIFSEIMLAESRDEIRGKNRRYFIGNRLKKRGYIPKLLNAYIYFYDKILEFLNQNDEFNSTISLEERLKFLYNCFCNDFKVVEIQLDIGDDAQVIFETLNARGTPLEASDLIRNYLFFRAEHNNEDPLVLFDKYWHQYEDTFWSLIIKQGRILRSRLEFFFIDFLVSKIAYEINHKRIFPEYKQFIQNKKPYESVEKELQEINKYSSFYTILIEPNVSDDYFSRFSKTLQLWDLTTANPLVLEIMQFDIDDEHKRLIFESIESYIIRRTICGKTSKNYNKIFLFLLREIKHKGISSNTFITILRDLKGESGNWPDDNEFKLAWLQKGVYGDLPSRRIQEILKRIEENERSRFSEKIEILSELSIEHIMPQDWKENWPLSDGIKVIDNEIYEAVYYKLLKKDEENARFDEINKRIELVNTFGNMTLLTQPLNSSISNASYEIKRKHIIDQSALRLNRYFQNISQWNEEQITKRGELLFETAVKIWKYLDS